MPRLNRLLRLSIAPYLFWPQQIITRNISSGLRCLSPRLSPQCHRQPDPLNTRRTDQAVMSRQELIKLQRTIGFSQSLLQYLGTFSRERTGRPPIGHGWVVITYCKVGHE